jgi:hypothetical protein
MAWLLDRAETDRLTATEATELRQGFEHLRACLANAGAQLRQAIRDAERARDEHATELLQLREPGLAVECRLCGAAAGAWCRPVSGDVTPTTLHVARLTDAGVLR